MNRKWMAGIAVGILVAAALILVGVGAYRAGERNGDDVAVVGQVLSESDSAGHTIIVDGHGWRGGRAADSGGSGLGLTIARQLDEAHGGTVVAANDAGGARLTVTMPSRQA